MSILRRLRPAACVVVAGLACAGCGPRSSSLEDVSFVEPGGFASDFRHRNGATGELFIAEMMGPGAALFDYDGDGDLDLYLRQGGALAGGLGGDDDGRGDLLYRNDLVRDEEGGAVARFVDRTAAAGIGAYGYGMGIAVGDVDGDGRPDIYLTNLGANALLRNAGDGSFVTVAGAGGADDSRWSVAATFFDADGDGRSDLWVGSYVDFDPVANHRTCRSAASAPDYCGPLSFEPQPDRLFRNLGGFSFEDATARSGLAAAATNALGVLAFDVDRDGWTDLYVASDAMPNVLWRNRGDGTFADEALTRGVAVNERGEREGSMGVDAGDFDRDGDFDLFLSHMATETHTLYRDEGGGYFRDVTSASGLAGATRAATGFGAAWIDYDRDGWLDLLIADGAVNHGSALDRADEPFPLGQGDQLLRNAGGRFDNASERLGAAATRLEVGRGAAFGDVERDGDPDVVVLANGGPARLLLDVEAPDARWIGVLPLLAPGGDAAVGVEVRATGGEGPGWLGRSRRDASYASANDPAVLLGLGEDGPRTLDLEVGWPAGTRRRYRSLPGDRYVVAVAPRRLPD